MQFITLQLITVIIAGLMVGNELAVSAFVHPQLCRLDDQCHASASKALALIYGRIMPFWYALTLVLMIGVTFILRLNQSSGASHFCRFPNPVLQAARASPAPLAKLGCSLNRPCFLL